MKKFFAALLALIPAFASSGELWGSATLASFHTKRSQHLNEENYGLGIEYHANRDVLYLVGAYRNSHEKRSVYAFAGWTPIHYGKLNLGVAGGLVNGYPKLNNGKITPAIMGLLMLEFRHAGVNLFLIPPPLKESPITIGLQVKFRFA